MNTLYVFGDSFVQDIPAKTGWVAQLSRLRNMTVKNYGVGGSCLEFSFLKLLEVIKTVQIDNDDIVIFVLTHPERLDLDYQIKKDTTSACKIHDSASIDTLPDPEFVKKYQLYRSNDIIENKHILYISLIKALADQNINTKFLVIPAFFEVQQNPIFKNTDNFLFVNGLFLEEISAREWNKFKITKTSVMDVLGFDPRTNHLTTTNLQELATAINEVIESWDISKLYKSRFKKNIFNKNVLTIDDIYRHYIDTGLLSKEWTEYLISQSFKNTLPSPKKKWIIF